MGGVDDDSVHASLHQSLHALECVCSDAHTGCHTESAFGILTSHRFVGCLSDILICYEAEQMILVIYYREFLNLVLQENLACTGQIYLLMCHHEIL